MGNNSLLARNLDSELITIDLVWCHAVTFICFISFMCNYVSLVLRRWVYLHYLFTAFAQWFSYCWVCSCENNMVIDRKIVTLAVCMRPLALYSTLLTLKVFVNTHWTHSDKDVIHCLSSFAPSLTSTWRVDLKKNAKMFKSGGVEASVCRTSLTTMSAETSSL